MTPVLPALRQQGRRRDASACRPRRRVVGDLWYACAWRSACERRAGCLASTASPRRLLNGARRLSSATAPSAVTPASGPAMTAPAPCRLRASVVRVIHPPNRPDEGVLATSTSRAEELPALPRAPVSQTACM